MMQSNLLYRINGNHNILVLKIFIDNSIVLWRAAFSIKFYRVFILFFYICNHCRIKAYIKTNGFTIILKVDTLFQISLQNFGGN